MKYGYIAPVIKKEDYIDDGKLHLGGLPIQLDGQWDEFLPADEFQHVGVETMACAIFGSLNAIEILERKLYGESGNWSDRFLAKMSGATPQGTDPHTVAETLRKKGVCREADWPNSPDLDTWEKFYSEIPDEVKTLAIEFKAKYDFGHQYISPSYDNIKNGLRYSPLGVAVFGWLLPDADGIYHRDGAPDSHWCVMYGYVDGKYFKIFDTYDNTHKKLDWAFGFSHIKQYTLAKNVVNESFWGQFLAILRDILGYPMGMARVFAGVNIPEGITKLAEKIKEYEGWGAPGTKVNGIVYPVGTKSWRNKNPGNVRYFKGGYLSIYGNVKCSADNFAQFPTYEQGWLYLQRMLWQRCKTNPNMTLRQLMATYAPSADDNDPDAYAVWLAKRLALVGADVPLSDFLKI